MSLSKQSSHASPSSPHPEAKAACFCLSVEDSLSDGPSSHLLLLSWAIDFFREKMPVVEAWDNTTQTQEAFNLLQPKK